MQGRNSKEKGKNLSSIGSMCQTWSLPVHGVDLVVHLVVVAAVLSNHQMITVCLLLYIIKHRNVSQIQSAITVDKVIRIKYMSKRLWN